MEDRFTRIKEDLAEGNPEALLMDGFEDALVGYATQFTKPPLALYDREKCLEILVARDGMSWEEAEEYFSFNCEGAWVGEHTPLIGMLDLSCAPSAPPDDDDTTQLSLFG